MRLIPSDTQDFAYTVTLFKVTMGGRIRVKLTNGTQVTRDVRNGEYVNLPIRRLYQAGTTAYGFNTSVSNTGPDRELAVPYAPNGTLPPIVIPAVIPVALVSANGNVTRVELIYDRPMTVSASNAYQFRRSNSNITHTGPTYEGNKLVFTLGSGGLENTNTCDVTAALGAAESVTGRPSAALTQYSVTNNTPPRPTITSMTVDTTGSIWTIALSEACIRTGTPTISISIGGGIGLTYHSGSGTNSFRFTAVSFTCESMAYNVSAGFLTSVATGRTSAANGNVVVNGTLPSIQFAIYDDSGYVRIKWNVPIANYRDAELKLYLNNSYAGQVTWGYDDYDSTYHYVGGTQPVFGDVIQIDVEANTVEAPTLTVTPPRNASYTRYPVDNQLSPPPVELLDASILPNGRTLRLTFNGETNYYDNGGSGLDVFSVRGEYGGPWVCVTTNPSEVFDFEMGFDDENLYNFITNTEIAMSLVTYNNCFSFFTDRDDIVINNNSLVGTSWSNPFPFVTNTYFPLDAAGIGFEFHLRHYATPSFAIIAAPVGAAGAAISVYNDAVAEFSQVATATTGPLGNDQVMEGCDFGDFYFDPAEYARNHILLNIAGYYEGGYLDVHEI